MSGEMILSIGYGTVMVLVGLFAWWTTRRFYARGPRFRASEKDQK